MDEDCTEMCAAMPICNKCGKPKHPRGRSVADAAANGYCDGDCSGYHQEPISGHLWPEEWREILESREILRIRQAANASSVPPSTPPAQQE